MKTLAVLLLLSTNIPAPGQSKKKTEMKFDCTCEDPVGSRFATAFRDLIAASPRYTQTTLSEEPVKIGEKGTRSNWVVSIISLDPNSGSGAQTAMSVVMTVGDTIFWTHWVQTCGANRVNECASSVFSDVDKEIQKLM